MNSNAYPSSSYPQPQQNINPAMLSRTGGYNNNNMMMPGGGGAINPAQLINGMGNQQSQSMTLNPAPAQLLHHHQQQQQQQQMMMNGMGMMGGMGMNMMGGMGNMNNMNIGVGGGGINPASLSSPANNIPMHHQPQAQPPMPNMGGMMMNQPMNPNPMAVLNSMGITREQLAAMPQQERQMKISAAMQAAGMFPERQLQQQHQQQVVSPQAAFFDRPSSSASSHSHSHGQQMMPPPPPRPPTAQGMQQQQGHSSRPGTAMSHHSPTIPGPQMQLQQQRPPSRVASAGAGEFTPQNMYNANMNGYTTKQATPQPQPQPPTPQPYQQHGSPPPMPGSPYRGNGNNMMQQKKKMESPRMGGIALPPQVMGPPGLPRTVSSEGMNGYAMQQQQQQRQSPRPGSSMGMSMGQGQQQRQGSMPPPMPMQQQQQGGMRQGSAPPVAAQQQQQQQQQLKVEMRMSVPPAPTAVPPQPAPVPQAIAPSASSSSSTSAVQPPTPAAAGSTPPGPAGPGPVIPQLPPLPANVSLNPAVTRVTPVPLLDSLKHIPPLSESEIADIQGWMKVDKEYEGVFRKMKERMGEEAREAFGLGKAAWWQKGYPGGNFSKYRRGREVFDVRYPRRRGEGGRKKVGRREGLKLPRKLDPDAANLPEQLVPIRLEFDVEHHKMRDTFIWNLNDPIVTPEVFAQSIVDDYALAPSYHSVIVKHIQDQLSDYKSHAVGYDSEAVEPVAKGEVEVFKGVIGDKEGKWWEGWRKRVRCDEVGARRKRRKMEESMCMEDGEDGMGDVEEEEEGEEKPLPLEEFRIEEDKLHEEMRVLIKLDIIVGSMKLDDQFEWDLDNPDASPEQFAAVYTQELGLGGEFQTAIAHSIREQVQTYQKSLFLVGHPSDGSLVQDDELRQSFLPSLATGARAVNEVQSFTPLLNYLSDGEIERNEKEREKDLNKRRKRNTRGRRGVALPDREPIRTYRTPAIGFPELDPATLALAAAANAPVSRRAAAAAASLTIANMVASENGERFTPQMMPAVIPQPPPSAAKEKKPKGLFKPPPFPAQVLRPRAQVVAPTPSTAADVSTLPAPLENDPPPPIPTVAAPPDSKAQKAITAKRAKELEREAKEREFVDGQHPNIINGVWHCSNCGCPESIAIGRRKGPLGDKSQCGTCGKFWHRHRRPRPVEYNSDPDFHSNLRKAEEAAKAPGAKKKGAAAALRAQSTTTATTPVPDLSEPQTPARSNGDAEAPSRQSPANNERDDDRAVSPMSTASSASEAPLAQKVKMNGSSHKFSTPAKASTSKPISTPVKVEATPKHVTPAPVSSASAPDGANKSAGEGIGANSTKSTWPPEWLSEAMKAMQTKYPHDRFEVILRKVGSSSTPEWRIKCSDCPGKLYTPGPGETLSNYEVHLKNRLHRQRVNDRVTAANS